MELIYGEQALLAPSCRRLRLRMSTYEEHIFSWQRYQELRSRTPIYKIRI